MKYTYAPLILIFFSYCTQANQNTPSSSKNNKLLALQHQLHQNGRSATAAASIGLGTYWLVDTIKTAIDIQNQPDTENGTYLNAAVAVGLISFGGYLLKPIMWDQNKTK